ncbi:MAG: dTDP-4-dehydrorhamnose 3,5-epimerase [Phycisphaerales bacterium]|nr:MAG: dTDP-4-dehydrorhamnose 3,5-epimerase [Phycisphaerales bacterium]
MRFVPTELDGAYIIEVEPITDERGSFARIFCEKEFAEKGLQGRFVQCNVAWNKAKGTLRGMHYQVAPHAEVKIVRCTRGVIHDVIVDLRPASSTYCKWTAVELDPWCNRMVYVPDGFAHGYQTLAPDTEVFYWMSAFYVPSAQRAVRWNDPVFGIKWPISDPKLSNRDRSLPDFEVRGPKGTRKDTYLG